MSGRFAAKVIPKVIRLENNRVDLIFEVNEGDLIKIESIRFIGNKPFLLRAQASGFKSENVAGGHFCQVWINMTCAS